MYSLVLVKTEHFWQQWRDAIKGPLVFNVIKKIRFSSKTKSLFMALLYKMSAKSLK